MAGQGLVEVDREETVDGRRRRYYRITGAGREAVVTEADRLAAAARVVQRAGRRRRGARRDAAAPPRT
jgi:DNA-binding PadR family transcriptional regulator